MATDEKKETDDAKASDEKKTRKSARGSKKSTKSTKAEAKTSTKSKRPRPAKKEAEVKAEAIEEGAPEADAAEAEIVAEEATKKPKKTRRRGKKPAEPKEPKEESKAAEDAAEASASDDSDDSDEQTATRREKPKPKKFRPKDRVKAGTKWLETLFEKMHLEGITVEGTVGDKVLEFNVQGGDASLLLGAGKASAKSLESIQTILREAIVSDYDTDYGIHLDVDNFRQRRTEHLEEVARGLADAAGKIGNSITIAGFNSFERRVVHQALSEDNDVKTDSEGRGSFRKLRVEPR